MKEVISEPRYIIIPTCTSNKGPSGKRIDLKDLKKQIKLEYDESAITILKEYGETIVNAGKATEMIDAIIKHRPK